MNSTFYSNFLSIYYLPDLSKAGGWVLFSTRILCVSIDVLFLVFFTLYTDFDSHYNAYIMPCLDFFLYSVSYDFISVK